MIGLCLADRYDVLAELGQGGMATVYRARDRVLGREVAVKLVSTAGLKEGAIERFQREARLVGRLDHPAVVPIYDFGHDGGHLFFVMPVLEGDTLHRLLRDRPPTLAQTLEILARVAEALDHSASRGVVHRDVKPENIMVAMADGTGAESVRRVWVMDFGLALGRASTRLTKTGNLPGTLAYLSPEQVLSADAIDGRSDLYSLGVILYQCLFGRPPFSGAPASVLYRIVHETPTPPEAETVDPLLLEVLEACLQKRPGDRIQTGGELAQALRQVASRVATSGPVAVGAWRRRGSERAPHLPLIGRDAELAALGRAFDRALPGELQLALVSGHPGLGKSRLLEALEDDARGRGSLVLRGRFAERESTFPYQAFCELVQDYFRQLHDGSLPRSSGFSSRSSTSTSTSRSRSRSRSRSKSSFGSGSSSSRSSESGLSDKRPVPALADLAPGLLTLFPPLAEVPEIRDAAPADPGGGTVTLDEPAQLYELVARTLGRLADGRSTVLVLEHLHAADASIDLIQYLMRRLSSAPILIAASYRPGSVGRRHPLVRLIRGLRDDPRFRDLRLSPLPFEAHARLVEEILGSPVDEDFSRRLFESTEGNPFFTRELLTALRDAGELAMGETGVFRAAAAAGDATSSADLLSAGDLPETIRSAVEVRLERLPVQPRRVLEAASVLGRRLSERELEEIVAEEEDGSPGSQDSQPIAGEDLEIAIDDLVVLGLLEEDRSSRRGDRLRFASGLVRDVVYRGLPRRRRRRLHRRRAEALERRAGRRLDRVAHELLHHYAEAGLAPQAIRFGLLHGRRSLDTYCWDDALYACAVALDFVSDPDADPSQRQEAAAQEAELRRIRAAALAAKGLLREAEVEGERALEKICGDASETTSGTPSDTQADTQSDRQADTQSAAAGAEIALFLAETAWRARRIDDTRRWLSRGTALARSAGEEARTTLASLLQLGATASNLAGDVEEARQLLHQAARLREELEPVPKPPSLPSGGTLRVAMTRSLTGLDPTDAFSAQDVEVSGLLFEPLLRADASGALHPCLGESWSRSDDGLAYRFHIDTRRRFADGTGVTAGAVKESFERAAHMAESRRPAVLEVVRAFEVAGDDQLILRLARPLASFPALLSDPRTAVAKRSEHGSDRAGSAPEDAGLDVPCGTGPFRLVERTRSSLALARRPDHPSPALLDRIEVELHAESRDVAGAWRRGGLHMARDLSPADVTEFLRHGARSADDGRLVETPQNNVYFVLLNPRGPSLRDPELRRIVATSVDARRLVWSTVPRFANPLAGWLPPGIAGHDAARQPRTMGREEAIRAMDSFRPLPVRLRAIEHPAFTDQYRPVSDALCDAWHLLGIEVDRRPVAITDFAEAMRDPEAFDLVFARWWPDYPDPDGFYFGAFHSSAGLFGALLASSAGSSRGDEPLDEALDEDLDEDLDEALDDAIEKARRHLEPAERGRLYRQLEQTLLDHHLVRPLFHDVEYRMVSSRVGGLETSPAPPFVNYPRLGLRHTSPAAEVERRAGRLVVPLGSRVDTLDPAWSFHADAAEVVANIFEPLTRLDEAAVAVPHLAESLEPDDGGRRWLCTLEEARFHDGRRLSARDVRYSFQRLLRSGSPDLRLFLAPLEGADEVMAGRGDLPGVRIVGDREVELRLARPAPHFPALLSNASTAIVPEGTEEFGPTWRHGTAGTGPFQLVAFQPGQRAELVAYGDYRRPGLPKVAELVFELGIGPRRAAEGFESGDFSMLQALATDDLEAFSRRPEFAAGLVEQPSFTTYFATLTAVRGPLAEPDRRRRVADLLSNLRPRLAQRLGRLGQAAGRLIPPSLLGLSDPAAEVGPTSPPTVDPHLEGVTLKVALHPSYGAGFRRLWREIRGALETAGLRLEPTQADVPEILQMTSRGELDLVFNRWIADYPDPSSFAQVIAAGPAAGQWRDPDLVRVAEQAMTEADRTKRRTLYLEFERLLADRALLVPLFHEQSWRLVRPGISGLRLRYGWPEVVYEELKIRG